MSIEDIERSGRTKEVVTDQNIKEIHKMILNGRKLKLNEIADTLKISTDRVHHIIHEYLAMRKLCAKLKWILRSPIDSHPSGLHTMNTLQRAEKYNSRLARLWRLYFGMRME
ncbi:hypothetical protein GWI33_019149 [Rhynchophorus ferrugineus]|uniref:Uncharacterized protein n=1 Tax=Rhynchophorus ferrugineus TaxID=354439 RepID=A0A834M4G9_RHYFE|nr:hypothetical protein GWI33_019149 [Rhynchophorus ferrugineus]